MKKKCNLCFNLYQPSGRRQLYCNKCRKIKKRIWNRKYEEKNKFKIKLRRKKQDREPLAKARYQRYRNTKKYREYSRNRYHSQKENKKKARYYVSNGVRDGKLIRPSNCEKCGIEDWGEKRSVIEAHHYLGYEKSNWLKVQWLCTDCHKLAEKGGL